MDYSQDTHGSNFTEVIDDRINNLQHPNQSQMGQNSLNVPYQQYDDFSTMDQDLFVDESSPNLPYTTNYYEQHPSFYNEFNNEQVTSTSSSYEPQDNNNYIPHIQSPSDVQNSLPLDLSPHFESEFEIPGFKIFIVAIPTISNLSNLNNVQNQSQNDSSFLFNNNSIQFQHQNQNYFTNDSF
ncbi:hypothetical protein C1645_739682 [Glomus cerebriforme]|uniref:Uncharacterized protein n=1 Tax=Glomus cerebriforme TaxID=658196 RepID=A0A397SPJ4_9GLOM|nr:hypothetical protein C1645_739682 [Glomus cerebriforme]